MNTPAPRDESHAGKPSRKERVREELRNYAIVAAYLYVCFAAVLFYKSALLREEGMNFLPHGLALTKALILGKFLLIGEAVGLGAGLHGSGLLRVVVTKSILFFLLLVVLSVLEEIVVGWAHGHAVAQTLAEFEKHSVYEMLSVSLLLLLVLIPLITAKEFTRALGPGGLSRIVDGLSSGKSG